MPSTSITSLFVGGDSSRYPTVPDYSPPEQKRISNTIANIDAPIPSALVIRFVVNYSLFHGRFVDYLSCIIYVDNKVLVAYSLDSTSRM